MQKRRKLFVVSVCMVFIVIVLGVAIVNNRTLFRMPAAYIKNKMLDEFPMGSNIQEVKEIIQQHDEWTSNLKVSPWGNKYNSDGKPEYNTGSSLGTGEYHIGTQHISVEIGSSWFLFTDVYFAFDDNDQLIDIAVYKTFAIE